MKIYLSPSIQESNVCAAGDVEAQHCGLIADAMEPYLRAAGIQFQRNERGMTLAQIVCASNAYGPDIHYAMHTNAVNKQVRGERAIITGSNSATNKLADILIAVQGEIYPSSLSSVYKTDIQYAELYAVHAPAVIDEICFHDNVEDAAWLHSNITNIAKNKVKALCKYFEIPFIDIGDVSTVTKLLEYLAVRAGCTTEEVVERLALLICFQDTVSNDYQQKGVQWLLENGIITQVRDGRASVNWGDLGVVAENILK